MNKIIIPLIAILALTAGYFLSQQLAPKPLVLQSATLIKTPIELPDVKLVDHDNKKFGKSRLRDKWTLMFFGYTNCPDVCPDSLHMLKTMHEQLSEDAKKDIQIVFVSVDPWRDTPEKLKSYVQFFNADFIGASADMPELTPLTKKLGIIHYTQGPTDNYDVAHSGSMTLINPDAKFTAVFSPPHDATQMAADLQAIRLYYQ